MESCRPGKSWVRGSQAALGQVCMIGMSAGRERAGNWREGERERREKDGWRDGERDGEKDGQREERDGEKDGERDGEKDGGRETERKMERERVGAKVQGSWRQREEV